MNLLTSTKLTRVIDAAAAAQTDIESTIIDMQGWKSVTFIVGFGAITGGAATSVKIQTGSNAALSDAADLEGSKITIADDDDTSICAIEIVEPVERYVRCVVSRATQDSVVDFGLAIQTGPSAMPTVHDTATVLATEIHASPSEGTA